MHKDWGGSRREAVNDQCQPKRSLQHVLREKFWKLKYILVGWEKEKARSCLKTVPKFNQHPFITA